MSRVRLSLCLLVVGAILGSALAVSFWSEPLASATASTLAQRGGRSVGGHTGTAVSTNNAPRADLSTRSSTTEAVSRPSLPSNPSTQPVDRPSTQPVDRPAADRPATQPVDRPAADRPSTLPVEDRPLADRPTTLPIEDRPLADRPSTLPVEDRPLADRPSTLPVERPIRDITVDPHYGLVAPDYRFYNGPNYVYPYNWYAYRHIMYPGYYTVYYYDPVTICTTEYYEYEGIYYCYTTVNYWWGHVPGPYHYYYGPAYAYPYAWYAARHIAYPTYYVVYATDPGPACVSEYYSYEGSYYCYVD